MANGTDDSPSLRKRHNGCASFLGLVQRIRAYPDDESRAWIFLLDSHENVQVANMKTIKGTKGYDIQAEFLLDSS